MRAASILVGLLALVAAGAGTVGFAATLPTTSQAMTHASVAATIAPTTCAVAATADTYADQSALNSGTNYGTVTTLHVRSFRTLALVSQNKRAFVRFDLATCAIPAGSRVKAASLELQLGTAPAAARTYDVHRIEAAWTETGLTWSAQPGFAGTATSSLDSSAVGARNADVTADVSSFLSGTPNHGWAIKDRSENSSTSYEGRFESDEAASQRPALVISYYP